MFSTADTVLVGTGDIVVTSRNRDLGRLGDIVLEIPPLAVKEGVELLLRDSPKQDGKSHDEEATRIVERLGRLALAIVQAAAYIIQRKPRITSLTEFLGRFEKGRKELLEFTPFEFWEYSTMQIHGEKEKQDALSVFTTCEMSFQQLRPVNGETESIWLTS